ncbi:thiamine pyrophosphate-dependent enzyme (plasmid) [Mycolicibacterium psychrotolerans]|uniref:thiamine pyrophosphate-dependent enzyme n=1 Tax=Mycolicibacterium psychrotolerans TaxID=216929 RepID=UPI003D6727A6
MTVQTETQPQRVARREFVAALMREIPDALVVTGLGSASYDVFSTGARDENFYLWGAMGAAAPLALGVALAQPDRSVVAITGDGEQLMGIGSLGTIGALLPPNLTIVVLDNGHFGETGMQPSHTSLGTDLVAVARGFGIRDADRVHDLGAAEDIGRTARARNGTRFVQVLIDADEPPRALPPRDGVANKNAFRAALGFPTF